MLVALYQYFDHYMNGCFPTGQPHQLFLGNLVISILIGGVFGGSALVFLWERWLRKMVFLRAVGLIFISLISMYLLINLATTVVSDFQNPASFSFPKFLSQLFNAIGDKIALLNFFFWLVVVFLTLGVLLVRDRFGPRVFLAFLLGKYFTPKKENRIFMFADLKSSTTIAEELGEEKYFHFLNDVFSMVVPEIIKSRGEIYQYVGDEIVVTWELQAGLRKANCLHSFFAVDSVLQQKESHFMETYGVAPKFRAGLHGGTITAGEIGVVKRELVYSGDVLNTASRIQAKCSEFDLSLLISKSLMDQINPKDLNAKTKALKDERLKGKASTMDLVSVSEMQPKVSYA
ncbi:MAG: adenylate/guanylate cyclase domain-containing protein [Bacteroidota bacterium]